MKSEKEIKGISKFLSFVLRHQPESIGLVLDEKGWADIDELMDKSAKRKVVFDRADLAYIAVNNNKQRFAIDEDSNRIRANQGHSIAIDADLATVVPPQILYHGTAQQNLESILTNGLEKRNRLHVHLSDEIATAKNVGARHGKPIILQIAAMEMHQEGYIFYLSENGVWLTDHIPSKYISYE